MTLIVEKLMLFLNSATSPSEVDVKFLKHIRKIYKYLQQLDKQRSMDPKFAESLLPLYSYYKEKCDMDSEAMSTVTSDSIMKSVKSAHGGVGPKHQLASLMAGATANDLGKIEESVASMSPSQGRNSSKKDLKGVKTPRGMNPDAGKKPQTQRHVGKAMISSVDLKNGMKLQNSPDGSSRMAL